MVTFSPARIWYGITVVLEKAGVVSGLFSFCRQTNYLLISLGFQGFI
jgi:hypothetical protein